MTKQAAPTVRSFLNRRSATDLLRKLGVTPERYADLITAKDSGKFVVDLSKIGQPAPPAEPVEEAKPASAEKPKRVVAPAKKAPVSAAGKAARKAVGKAVKEAEKKAESPAKKRAGASKRKDGRLSVAARCLELFQAGKGNKDVWAMIQAEYGLDDEKAHYPAWYRSHYRRKGLLPRPAKED